MSTVTISLPQGLKRFVESEVASAGYGNVSEYFRALLREAQARNLRTALDAQLLGALAVPPAAADETFWRQLRSEAQRLLKDVGHSSTSGWPASIARYRPKVEVLCRESGARELALVGASARDPGESTPLQCAVHLGNQDSEARARAYADFNSALAGIFERPIDLIEIGSMGATRLRRLIEETRRVLYLAATSD
jgi:antitoxin ParD1/3/4